MYKLPVWQTVIDAYKFTFGQWRWVLRYAAPLLLLIGFLALFGAYFSAGNRSMSGPVFGFFAAVVVVGIALAVGFAVAMHRHYLLGPDPRGIKTTLSWQRRHWRFLGGAILVSLGMGILSALFMVPLFAAFALDLPGIFDAAFDNPLLTQLVTSVIGLVIWSLVFMIVCSALLKFPLRAIEAPAENFETTEKLVHGNIRRMTGVFILGDFIPFTIFDYLTTAWWSASAGADTVGNEPISFGLSLSEQLFSVVYVLGGFLWLAVTAVMLSMVYKQLSENVTLPDTPAAPPNPPDADKYAL